MITVSGLVLNYLNDLPIPYCNVFITNSGSTALYSGVTNEAGLYTITGIETPVLEYLTYFGEKIGYRSYTRTLTNRVTEVTLHLQPVANLITGSGTSIAQMLPTAFTTSTNIRQLKNTPTHLYAVTDDGLDIIDRNSLVNSAYLLYSGGLTCITLDDRACAVSGIQVGTSNSGVYQFTIPDFINLENKNITSSLVRKFAVGFGAGLTSNFINCIDRNYHGEFIVGTSSGIDYFTTTNARYSTTFTGALGVTACAISEHGDLYYSPTNSGLYVKYSGSSNWTDPDYIVNVGSSFPIQSNLVNDIKLTSISGQNIIFLATPSGLLYYQEDRNDINATGSGASILNNFP